MERELRRLRWALVGAAILLAVAWVFGPGRYRLVVSDPLVYRLDTVTGRAEALIPDADSDFELVKVGEYFQPPTKAEQGKPIWTTEELMKEFRIKKSKQAE